MPDGEIDIDVERELDQLFRVPPEGFVAARTALARRLQAAGGADDARRIKAWRRPTRPIWALNHLALAGEDTVPDLVAAATAVAELQSSGAGGLRDAITELRSATRRAIDEAVTAIPSVRAADAAEIAAALSAIVAESDALHLLARGRLLQVPEPGLSTFGFGADGPAPSESTTSSRTRASSSPDRKRKDDSARRQAAAGAEAAVASAEDALRSARSGAEAAEATRRDSIERVDRARAELAEAETEAGASASEAAAAREEEAAAAQAVADARSALASLREG